MHVNDIASVYVVQMGDDRVKIGRSCHAYKRLIELRSQLKVRDLSLVFIGNCNAQMTVAIEARAHALLAQSREGSEWFSVSAKEAIEAIKQAATEMRCLLEAPAPAIAPYRRHNPRWQDGSSAVMTFRAPPAIRERIELMARREGLTLSKAILKVLAAHLPRS